MSRYTHTGARKERRMRTRREKVKKESVSRKKFLTLTTDWPFFPPSLSPLFFSVLRRKETDGKGDSSYWGSKW